MVIWLLHNTFLAATSRHKSRRVCTAHRFGTGLPGLAQWRDRKAWRIRSSNIGPEAEGVCSIARGAGGSARPSVPFDKLRASSCTFNIEFSPERDQENSPMRRMRQGRFPRSRSVGARQAWAGSENHAPGCNLSLVMGTRFGVGTPAGRADTPSAANSNRVASRQSDAV